MKMKIKKLVLQFKKKKGKRSKQKFMQFFRIYVTFVLKGGGRYAIFVWKNIENVYICQPTHHLTLEL